MQTLQQRRSSRAVPLDELAGAGPGSVELLDESEQDKVIQDLARHAYSGYSSSKNALAALQFLLGCLMFVLGWFESLNVKSPIKSRRIMQGLLSGSGLSFWIVSWYTFSQRSPLFKDYLEQQHNNTAIKREQQQQGHVTRIVAGGASLLVSMCWLLVVFVGKQRFRGVGTTVELILSLFNILMFAVSIYIEYEHTKADGLLKSLIQKKYKHKKV